MDIMGSSTPQTIRIAVNFKVLNFHKEKNPLMAQSVLRIRRGKQRRRED